MGIPVSQDQNGYTCKVTRTVSVRCDLCSLNRKTKYVARVLGHTGVGTLNLGDSHTTF